MRFFGGTAYALWSPQMPRGSRLTSGNGSLCRTQHDQTVLRSDMCNVGGREVRLDSEELGGWVIGKLGSLGLA